MKKIIKPAFLLSFAIFLIACNTKKTEPAAAVIDKEQIKKEIQAKENEFAEVYNSGEMRNIGYYADDAITFAQNNPPLVGKTAIVEYLRANLDSVANSNKISFNTNEIFISCDGEHVLEIGAYKVVNASDSIVNSGNYMSLFVKKDGKYVCLRDMSACDIPMK